jgi:ribosomal protein L35
LRRFRRKKFGIEETTSTLTKDEDLKKQRAERFHVIENASEEEKRKLREKRFSSMKPNESMRMDAPDEAEIQKRKERLKRFGTSQTQVRKYVQRLSRRSLLMFYFCSEFLDL